MSGLCRYVAEFVRPYLTSYEGLVQLRWSCPETFSRDLYESRFASCGYRPSATMGGTYPTDEPTEARHRKPLTLVLCFDGTSNEFRNHVCQTALSPDIIFPLDIMIF